MTKSPAGDIRITAEPDLVEAVLAALGAAPSLTVTRVSKAQPAADGRQRLYVRVR